MPQTKITTAANASLCRISPKLRSGKDRERAEELDRYLAEAEGGLRAILKAGFFLECLAEDLPHGKLGDWVEANCRRTWRTVQRWKQIAANVGEAVGVDYKHRIALKLHEVLDLPPANVPAELKPIREKIEAEIAGKSYRQLFLEFKQSKDGESADRGRRKGEGGKRALTAAERGIKTAEQANAATKEMQALAVQIGPAFTALPDDDLEAHLHFVETHTHAVKEWLKTPTTRRDVKVIAALLKF